MKIHYLSYINISLLILVLVFAPVPAFAISTDIDVRIMSRGAKFIGTSMGGVEIVLRDVDSGEIYARGVTRGGTGSTDKIMLQSHKRNDVVADESAAVFNTSIQLSEPRLIEVEARGPLAQRQSMNRVTATQWVVPGKHLTGGNGWMLEMPGFVVDILDPPAHFTWSELPRTVVVRANVLKMCGCPLTPGGLWDANQYEVHGILKHNGNIVREFKLEYAGEPSQFQGALDLNAPGAYEIMVYAHDPHTGNTGLDRTTIRLVQE